ncbi:ABC transporter permease [Cetobacterium sp.]|uniref:ABC transporter permease n=1 Tax=Cetobacterium sp. TaxID=2071632 RepID=UPI002FC6C26B
MYEGIFSENYILFKNTMFTSIISSIGATFIGSCIAFYIVFSNSWSGKALYNFLLITMVSPPFVFGLSFITLFGRRGLITYRLLGLKINPYGWEGIVILQIIGELSFAAFLLVESFKRIDGRLIDASRSLGASQWETIKRIVLPFSFTGIIGVFFILFTKNLADFGTPIIIGGNYSTLATEAYLTVIGRGDLSKASAMTTLLLFPALLLFYCYRKNLEKSNTLYSSSKGGENLNFSLSPPLLLNIFLTIVSTAFIVIMFLQYASIFLSGFYNYTINGFQFTIEYFEMFKLGKYTTFIRSIYYSIIAGTVSAVIGITISYFTERKDMKTMKFIEFIASLPYIIPGTFFGLGYILAFNSFPFSLTGTATIVILNCIFRQVSIGSKAGNSLFSKIDKNLEKAAQDLGAPKIRVISDIVFPLVKPAFMVAFINGFTTTMTTTGAIIFLISPGASVATVEMFNTIRDGDYGLASIIAIFIIIVTFLINIIAIKFIEK